MYKKKKNSTANLNIEMEPFVGKWHQQQYEQQHSLEREIEMIRFKSKCKGIYWLDTLS